MNEEFKNFLSQLCEVEKDEVILKKIDSPEKLIPLLLKRVHPNNLQLLVSIIKQSLLPSICLKTNDEIDLLFLKIEKKNQIFYLIKIFKIKLSNSQQNDLKGINKLLLKELLIFQNLLFLWKNT